jgi:hypothetical protein
MTNLARIVIGCISATFLTGAASIAGTDTFTYTLNNTLAEANGVRRSFPMAARSVRQATLLERSRG